jgi:predicted secreted protein
LPHRFDPKPYVSAAALSGRDAFGTTAPANRQQRATMPLKGRSIRTRNFTSAEVDVALAVARMRWRRVLVGLKSRSSRLLDSDASFKAMAIFAGTASCLTLIIVLLSI